MSPPESHGPVPIPAAGSKAETQERILGEALALFLHRGFERTSIQQIATRAGVSRSAVFWHFGDKESLFREAFRRALVPFYEEIQSEVSHIDPKQRLFDLLDAYERVVAEHESSIRSIVRWLFESEKVRASLLGTLFALHGEFVRDVRSALEESLADAREAAPLAAALVSLLDGNLLLSMLTGSAGDRELRRAGLRLLTRRGLIERSDEDDG